MKESVAIAKEADAKKDFSPTKSDNNIHRIRDEPERQLGSLRSVIDNITRDGGTPSVDSIATELSSMSIGGRAPALLALQQTHGNRYVQRVVAGIQAKLVVGQPGDKYEQEADRVADAVMRTAEPEVQWQVGEEELLQVKSIGDVTPEVTHDLESQINTIRGGGKPLSESERAFFEPRFGVNFGQVRVHTGTQAAESAQVLNARAYTLGQHVVFGEGQYAPGTAVGRRLLAHELTHVLQQGDRTRLAHKKSLTVADKNHTHDIIVVNRMSGDEENGEPILIKSTNNKVQKRDNGEEGEETEYVSTEEFDLTQQKNEHHQLINRLQPRYLSNLRRNALNARLANECFIEFYESGINQLRSTGTIGAGVGYLFGTPGAVVALCIIVLTEVAAQGLSSRSAKIAAAATGIQTRLDSAIAENDERFQNLRDQIDSMSSLDWAEWAPIWNTIANIGMPEIVPENILYRDLLIELARGGGYNISGSQWNVDNMSIFGRAPWYHSWDWGSPGWVNGRDIADELNALAEVDPSTRRRVSINPLLIL